jgi:diadenosine tetraphosphate (Ap4A) HIT family hydrolase
MFKLDARLEQDCYFISDLTLSRLLLMNDSNYLWFILVPRVEGVFDLIDLAFEQQIELLKEVNSIGEMLRNEFKIDKLNVASLGNVVRQLHIHVIGRFENDIAFPRPVWGVKEAKVFDKESAMVLIDKVKSCLNL